MTSNAQVSLDEQVNCYRALLDSFYNKPWFAGVYWWKIETDASGGPQDSGMVPWNKPVMDTIRKFYVGSTPGFAAE